MKLNCDMGESFGCWQMGNDAKVMPYINQANIACGFHASDPQTIDKTIKLAKKYQVEIGAHPGYPDLLGFGRRRFQASADEVRNLLVYQIGAIAGLCKANNTFIQYVKPHGSLNHDMMHSDTLLLTIMKTIVSYNAALPLMIVATPQRKKHQQLSREAGIKLIYEAFADRLYNDCGQLTPRSLKGAVFENPERIIAQVKSIQAGFIITSSGEKKAIHADTICIHGDNRASVKASQTIFELLKKP